MIYRHLGMKLNPMDPLQSPDHEAQN